MITKHTAFISDARAMQAQNVVRTDHFIPLVNMLLEKESRLRALMQRYEHVLVDEVQDTDRAQYALVRTLTERSNNAFFVGDPDQAIYAFRGAEVCRACIVSCFASRVRCCAAFARFLALPGVAQQQRLVRG